jgi:putative ABC transport system substrate-binding protein
MPTQKDADASKTYRVGVLNALDYFAPSIDGFKEQMTALGYDEGTDIVYDVQRGEKPVGNKDILNKFVSDHVDLIVVFPTEASLEAKEVTRGTNVPIISLNAAFEVGNLVDGIQHPGGNLTGVRFPIPEVAAKRVEVLHEIAPKATRILIPYLKDYPTAPPSIKAAHTIADPRGLTIIEAPFSTPDELHAYLASNEANPEFDAILYVPEPISIIPPFADQIQAFADEHKIPVAGVGLTDTDRGAAFSLIPNAKNVGALAAPLADKIFHGTPPGDIPIVTPDAVFEINFKVIERLGLTVSEGLLSTASRIVH